MQSSHSQSLRKGLHTDPRHAERRASIADFPASFTPPTQALVDSDTMQALLHRKSSAAPLSASSPVMTSDGVDFIIDRQLDLPNALPVKAGSPKSSSKQPRKRTNTNGSLSNEVCAAYTTRAHIADILPLVKRADRPCALASTRFCLLLPLATVAKAAADRLTQSLPSALSYCRKRLHQRPNHHDLQSYAALLRQEIWHRLWDWNQSVLLGHLPSQSRRHQKLPNHLQVVSYILSRPRYYQPLNTKPQIR